MYCSTINDFPKTNKMAERFLNTNEFTLDELKGELRPEISLSHMKVLTLIKAKSNVFL